MTKAEVDVTSDFDYLTRFLPPGWQAKAKELGALRRCRKVPDAETLLRVLLIHLAEGCSLRETAVRAGEGNLIRLSDVGMAWDKDLELTALCERLWDMARYAFVDLDKAANFSARNWAAVKPKRR